MICLFGLHTFPINFRDQAQELHFVHFVTCNGVFNGEGICIVGIPLGVLRRICVWVTGQDTCSDSRLKIFMYAKEPSLVDLVDSP